MGVDGELILLFASDVVFLSDVLSGDAHVVVIVNIPEPVVNHGVDDLLITEAISLASLHEEIGRVGHGFHASGNDDGTVAGLDGLRREGDSFESRATNLVYSHGTYFGRQTSEDGGLASGILTESSGEDVAHDAFVHLLGIDVGAVHGFANDDGAELRRGKIGETSLKFSHRRATAGDDDNLIRCGHK